MFTVLICTYNRPEMLRQSLAALLEQTEDKPDQVVIVNGGRPDADEVVQAFRSRPDLASIDICLIKTTNKNLAASRNVGLPQCMGDIIAMTDDDAEVFPDWVARIKRAHAAHPEAGAIGGAVLGANKASFISRVADRVTFPSYPDVRPVRTLPGVNISYKRSVVKRIGPQDETLFRGEDVDYNWRVKRFGYEILFDPEIRVLHHHRSTLKGFLNQHYMYGRAYYRVRLKWPDMYCVYPHALRRPKDLIKAANYVAAVLYEPLFASLRMDRTVDKFAAYPLLVANQLAWRAGMVRERASG